MEPTVTETQRPCESHACRHPHRQIVVGLDVDGCVVWCSEQGLKFTPTGVRHPGCPDPRVAALGGDTKAVAMTARMDQQLERELSPREAEDALTAAFEKQRAG